ncbi:hypothetical protein FHR71_004049 [Methylobacterium sp. RAS18]|nr:hypothetical protein [Methylobacterium sp. RAS18]
MSFDLTPWRRWFAWHPMNCEGRWTWLRTIERRSCVLDSCGHRWDDSEYREPPPTSASPDQHKKPKV